MATERQIEANRANAQRSTGPRTLEGKAQSALNGLVHGLRAATVVLPDENADEYETLRHDLIAHFQPQDVLEQQLVDMMATAQWTLERARRQELAALSKLAEEAVARCDPNDQVACDRARELARFDGSKEGALRLRYIMAQDNAYHRALRGLLSVRRLRLREEKEAEARRRRQEREEKAAAKQALTPTKPQVAAPLPSEPNPLPLGPPRSYETLMQSMLNPLELPAHSSFVAFSATPPRR